MSGNRLVTFEVGSSELFDTLQAMNGDCSDLGQKLAGVLLTGEQSALEAIGLAMYGVVVKDTSIAVTAEDRK